MKQIYLKISLPNQFYNKIKSIRDKYNADHESVEDTVSIMVQHRLQGWYPGIEVEFFNYQQEEISDSGSMTNA
jgi:hypothetical protein